MEYEILQKLFLPLKDFETFFLKVKMSPLAQPHA